jgi:GNAT superfamily N-acetyltransferase
MMTITITQRMTAPLLVRFVLESSLAYPDDGDVDGRLACWWRGEGQWAVAWHERELAGVACLVTLDDGPYAGASCLYWLEVLSAFQGRGLGRALLQWALTHADATPLLIASTPEAAPFYRRFLAVWSEPTPNTFVVEGGDAQLHNELLTARMVGTHLDNQ